METDYIILLLKEFLSSVPLYLLVGKLQLRSIRKLLHSVIKSFIFLLFIYGFEWKLLYTTASAALIEYITLKWILNFQMDDFIQQIRNLKRLSTVICGNCVSYLLTQFKAWYARFFQWELKWKYSNTADRNEILSWLYELQRPNKTKIFIHCHIIFICERVK